MGVRVGSQSKILLMGTPRFSAMVFQDIVHHFPDLAFSVVSRIDKPKGRGRALLKSPVSDWALQKGLPLYRFSDKLAVEAFVQDYQPDLVLVVAYGLILPASIVHSFYCVNAHASLLPLYRGASPIQSALLSGDSHTGVTLIKMNEKMDEGDMISVAKCPILPDDSFPSLHDKLASLSARLMRDMMSLFFSGQPLPLVAQQASNATYCEKIKPQAFELFSSEDRDTKYRKIKAYYPFAFVHHHGKRIRILNAEIQQGILRPIQVQPEGKSVMSYEDYLRGYKQALLL